MGKGRGRSRGRGRGQKASAPGQDNVPGIETQEEKPAQAVRPGSGLLRQAGGEIPKERCSTGNEFAERNDRYENAVEHEENASTTVKQEHDIVMPVQNMDKVNIAGTGESSSVTNEPGGQVKQRAPVPHLNGSEVTTSSRGASQAGDFSVNMSTETNKLADQVKKISINKTGSSAASTKPKVVGTQLLKRPNSGKMGRQIQLKANMIRLKIPEYGDIYHYDVVIVPDKCPSKTNQIVIKAMVDAYQTLFKDRPVFDGKKNLFSKQPLPIGNKSQTFEVAVRDEGRDTDRSFKVTIKYASRVSLEALALGLKGRNEIPRETIHALEVVLRMAPSARYITVGRSFFSEPKPGTAIQLGGGCEMWYGSYQSIRPAQWGMLVNIDQAATAFHKSQLITDYLEELVRNCNLNEPLTDRDRVNFEKKVRGFKVEFTYIVGQKRQKRIVGLSKESARNLTFERDDDGKKRKISVAQYFHEKYNIQLRYPNLQCLKAGSAEKTIHLPMELCTIVPGQRCVKRLSESQTSVMIRKTATDALERKKNIESRVKQAEFDRDPHLKSFDMRIDNQFVSFEGRVLTPPKIALADKKVVMPRDGKWDMRGSKFYEGKKIDCWALLICVPYPKCQENTAVRFCDDLSRISSSLDMTINKRPAYVNYLKRDMTVKQLFDDMLKNIPNVQLTVVVLDGTRYETVKSLADTYYGILTQCIKCKNVVKCNDQLLANLCMKINAKMAGINGVFSSDIYRPRSVFERPVIFLGADVTHPSPGETRKPSIAAVVGSLDNHPMKYAARVRAQGPRKEIIEDLALMTKQLLLDFYRAQKKSKPDKIIMYRDGVSEGQFSQVLEHELVAIRKACHDLDKDYQPGITFITVQKRHHVRLFADNIKDQVGKSKNIPAGTVVDQAICHPTEFDFYLCSHNGIQGTSRPSHYRVLWDDSKFTADELQQLTYALCHNYARCTRSVSIPPPAYYAHHVAMRANYHIQAMQLNNSDGSSTHSQSGSTNIDAVNDGLEAALKIHNNLLSKMYFI
eukprot:gene18557-20424_t